MAVATQEKLIFAVPDSATQPLDLLFSDKCRAIRPEIPDDEYLTEIIFPGLYEGHSRRNNIVVVYTRRAKDLRQNEFDGSVLVFGTVTTRRNELLAVCWVTRFKEPELPGLEEWMDWTNPLAGVCAQAQDPEVTDAGGCVCDLDPDFVKETVRQMERDYLAMEQNTAVNTAV